GKVTSVFMRQYLGKKQILQIVGRVEGKQLLLKRVGMGDLKPAPWNDKVISLYRQRLLFQKRKLKPGDTFAFQVFEPSINLVVTNRITVKDNEAVQIPWKKKREQFLRAEIVADEITSTRPDGKVDRFQVPPMTVWLGKDLLPVKTLMEAPGLGKITSY